MDDYSKVTYGMRDKLQLIRKDDKDALFHTQAAGAGKVVLSKPYDDGELKVICGVK